MTIVPPAPGLIEQLRHMVQMLVDPFGQFFFDGLLLELVTFPELDVQGPGHLVEVPADSSKLPARFPYGVHFFISEDRHPVQRPQSFLVPKQSCEYVSFDLMSHKTHFRPR